MVITDNDFQRLVAYVKQDVGIDLTQKRTLVDTRLENYLTTQGYSSLGEYLNIATMSASGKEHEELINILTTNHTFFWREEKHFEYMLSHVLPELHKKYANTRDLRIWCAASSSGEEPYTLAMLNMEHFGIEHGNWDTTILATDISTKVLKKAQMGIYSADAITPLPDSYQRKYFDHRGEIVEVKDYLKKEVLFRKLNLVEPYPFRKKLHVIFCRNVLIYFDEPTKKQIVDRMVDNLEVGGYLFIGTTESVSKSTDRLEYVIPSVYRKVCR